MDSARTSLQEYRDNMKRTFDKGRKETEVMNGDQVYLRNDAKADSLDPRYIGPFTVVSTRPPNVTINTGSGTKNVHLNCCKVIPFQINPQNQNDHTNFELPTTLDMTYNQSDHDSSTATEEPIETEPNQPSRETCPWGATRVTRSGRIIQKPLRFRDTPDGNPFPEGK